MINYIIPSQNQCYFCCCQFDETKRKGRISMKREEQAHIISHCILNNLFNKCREFTEEWNQYNRISLCRECHLAFDDKDTINKGQKYADDSSIYVTDRLLYPFSEEWNYLPHNYITSFTDYKEEMEFVKEAMEFGHSSFSLQYYHKGKTYQRDIKFEETSIIRSYLFYLYFRIHSPAHLIRVEKQMTEKKLKLKEIKDNKKTYLRLLKNKQNRFYNPKRRKLSHNLISNISINKIRTIYKKLKRNYEDIEKQIQELLNLRQIYIQKLTISGKIHRIKQRHSFYNGLKSIKDYL